MSQVKKWNTPLCNVITGLICPYSWIDAQRIRVNGIVAGFGSATEGFFYLFTVQREGDILRLLTRDGTAFAVFGRAGSVAAAPVIDVAVSVE